MLIEIFLYVINKHIILFYVFYLSIPQSCLPIVKTPPPAH